MADQYIVHNVINNVDRIYKEAIKTVGSDYNVLPLWENYLNFKIT